MSLARAFTLRGREHGSLGSRFGSIRARNKPQLDAAPKRYNISGPIQLVSTTNMLSFNAPDVATAAMNYQLNNTARPSPLSSSSSAASATDRFSADCTDSDMSLVSDSSTIASSDSATTSPNPDRNSACYFSVPALANDKDILVLVQPTTPTTAPDDTVDAQDWSVPVLQLPAKSLKRASSIQLPSPAFVPQLPKRALSHSKREHERLARRRSLRHSLTAPLACFDSISTAASATSTGSSPLSSIVDHPFSSELEQLDELAEDFAPLDFSTAENDADVAIMQTHGLMKFSADDYAAEFAPMAMAFADDHEDMVRHGSGFY